MMTLRCPSAITVVAPDPLANAVGFASSSIEYPNERLSRGLAVGPPLDVCQSADVPPLTLNDECIHDQWVSKRGEVAIETRP